MDDGIFVLLSEGACKRASTVIQQDMISAGLFSQDKKCEWSPKQCLEWTGISIDMSRFCLSIPERRIQSCLQSIFQIIRAKGHTTPRCLDSVVGKIVSMSVVLGGISQLQTRFCHLDIILRTGWDRHMRLMGVSMDELLFWQSNLSNLNNRDLGVDTREFTVVFSDASKTGGAATVTLDGQEHISFQQWTEEERKESSTFRELSAV